MEKWPDKEVDAKEKDPGSRRTYTVLYLFVFLSFKWEGQPDFELSTIFWSLFLYTYI